MATMRICLRRRPNKDGTLPLVIRVTKDRTPTYIGIGHAVFESDWDDKKQRVKKSHPNSARLNNLLLKKLAEANDNLIKLDDEGKTVSAKTVSASTARKKKATFFGQAAIFVDNLRKSGKYGRHTTEAGRVRIFREFVGSDIGFKDITVTLLNQFRAHLLGVRKVRERTVANYMMLIRTIYNQAIQSGVTDRKGYPFGKDKVAIKLPDSVKVGLTREEVGLIERAELSGYDHHARNVWLLSFYFAGMRLSDVIKLKWADFKDGRLHYIMSKNNKPGSLKVPDKALAILVQYEGDEPKHDLVLPELKELDRLEPYSVQRKISFSGKRLEDSLKKTAKGLGIDKKLSMHIARHTFAQIASDKIPVQVLQKLYRHTNITTTIGYQSNFTTRDTDDALERVLEGEA